MAERKETSHPAKKPATPAAREHRQRAQPESLRLRGISASLIVNDLEKSAAWYRDVLGFTVGERLEEKGQLRSIALKAGACELTLGQDDFAKGRDRKKGEGFRLRVTTVQDIAMIAERVKTAGWPIDRGPVETPWGEWAFAITDPDGFKLTFIQG
jgi:catechol 2,3-dioxygenase-like lactoylglutathione lyase family enzyme